MNGVDRSNTGMTGGQKTLIGCSIAVVVVVIVIVFGGMWAWNQFRQAAADAMYFAAVEMVGDTDLPQQQQDAILAELAGLRDEFKAGDIGFTQLGLVMSQVMESPVMAVIVLAGADGQYIEPSGLTDEEKDDARLTVQRFMRGVIDDSITDQEAMDAWDRITERIPGNPDPSARRVRSSIPDDELIELISDLRQTAEDAGVPDEPYEPDVAAELSRAIDRALGR